MNSKNIEIKRTIVTDNYTIEIPEDLVKQTEEYVNVKFKDGREQKIGMHDYSAMYAVPGLYEKVVYDILKCTSHFVLADRIKNVSSKNKIRVLEVGAGNGVFAEELQNKNNVEYMMGIDITPEAKEAAVRDRPKTYNEYIVADVAALDKTAQQRIKSNNFDFLVIPSALALDHIPVKSLLLAIDLLPQGAYLVFNLKKKFISDFFDVCTDTDKCHFREEIINEKLRNVHYEEYIHRYNFSGEPYYYSCFIFEKK